MKIHAFVLAIGGLVGAATIAQAQKAPDLPKGPLEALQDDFGKVVGANLRVPDVIIGQPGFFAPGAPAQEIGGVMRTSQQIPGAIFAGILKPFADADAAASPPPPPAPAAPAPHHLRHARAHRHHAPAQG